MDGVIYRGGELIPGAKEFIRKLIREDLGNYAYAPDYIIQSIQEMMDQ